MDGTTNRAHSDRSTTQYGTRQTVSTTAAAASTGAATPSRVGPFGRTERTVSSNADACGETESWSMWLSKLERWDGKDSRRFKEQEPALCGETNRTSNSRREPLGPALADLRETRRDPGGVVGEADLLVLRPRRRLLEPRLGHQGPRARIGRAVRQHHGEFGLRLRRRHEMTELPGLLRPRVSPRDLQVRLVDLRLVPHQFERHLVIDQVDGARAPHRDHVDLAVADELLRLRAIAPPRLDARLELVHLAERAVEVHRIELVLRHAIGEQREGEARERAVEQAAAAGKLLHVPEIRPALRPAVRKLVLAVDDVGAERVAGDGIVANDVGRQIVGLGGDLVDLLEQVLQHGLAVFDVAEIDHVPLVVAGLHLRLELGEGDPRHGLDRNSGLRRER